MAQPSTLHRSLELAGTLPALMVAADRVAATVIQGVHGRRRVGQGDAFWQYRPYRDGDGAKQIDWRQSARSRHQHLAVARRLAVDALRVAEEHRYQASARRADHARTGEPAGRCRRAGD